HRHHATTSISGTEKDFPIEDTRAVLKARGMNLSLTRRPGQVAVENYW
ncbi:hypothetical protein ACLBUO_25305, partial [Pseudomonas aeruginosa]